jgi:preprotein translocase subunit YajC
MDLQLPLLLAQANPFDWKAQAPLLLMILGVMYFIVIRPQQKQAKETQAMLGSLKKGDEVATTGGIVARVHQVDDKVVVLDVGGGVKIKVLKSAIQTKATVEAPKEAPKADSGEAKKEEK